MTFTKAEWEVLSCANEDFYGLSEVSRGIGSEVDGGGVSNAIRSLLHDHLIYLSWFSHEKNQGEPVANGEAVALVEDPTNWEPSVYGERYLAFAATPAGERAWRTSKPPALENRTKSPNS